MNLRRTPVMPNPYEPPHAAGGDNNPAGAASRDALATLIRAFLSSEITAFELDEGLDAFDDSDDPVIQHVATTVWCLYDDFEDHEVCVSKAEWDYLQRLLLVLESGCRVETHSERRWSFKQWIAAVSLCVFAYCAVQMGWGTHLFLLAVPFGLISMALSCWQQRTDSDVDPYQQSIVPFASFSDLATAYRSSRFRKIPYPRQLETRTIRSPLMNRFRQLYFYTLWLILSQIPLLFQLLPKNRGWTRIQAA